MKIKHIWSILCKESVIDRDSNIISIHGVFEELTVSLSPMKETKILPEKIGVPISYEIVSLWLKETKDKSIKAKIKYTLVSPESSELINTIQDIEMPANIRRFRSRMKIAGMPVTKEGDYSFNISIKKDGEKDFQFVSQIPFEVKIKLENPQSRNLLN